MQSQIVRFHDESMKCGVAGKGRLGGMGLGSNVGQIEDIKGNDGLGHDDYKPDIGCREKNCLDTIG